MNPTQQAIAYLLLLLTIAPALGLSRRIPEVRPISKGRATFGIVFSYALAALPIIFTARAASSGLIVLGLRRVNPDPQFSILHQPIAYWTTYGIYLLLCVGFLAFAFKYTRHAILMYRGRP